MNFDPADIASKIPALISRCPDVEWIADESRVDRLSHDFYWFSPVLKRELEPLRAHVVARPRTEDEIRAVVASCARLGVPITARGSGTGNYGQCIPLHGGVLLDLSGYNQFLWQRAGVMRGQVGLRLGDVDARTRPEGWELRCVPSTFRSASLGGLYGGGFGGVGSINFGPLAAHAMCWA
jgi:FAD/FMN-containing dehydrogenase